MTDHKPDPFSDPDLDLPPDAGHGPDLFAFALNLYRTPLQYLPLIESDRTLPAGLGRCLEALNKPEDAAAWTDLAERLGSTAGELRSATFFLVRRLLFPEGADHYRVLGLDPGADIDRIKAHYRLLMALFHPDRNPEGDEWNQLYAPKINDAYNVLKSPDRRRRYDRERAQQDGAGETEPQRRSRGVGMGPALGTAGQEAGRLDSAPSRYRGLAVWTVVLLSGLLAVGLVLRQTETLEVGARGEAPRQVSHERADEALGVALARSASPLSLTPRRAGGESPAAPARTGGNGPPGPPAKVEYEQVPVELLFDTVPAAPQAPEGPGPAVADPPPRPAGAQPSPAPASREKVAASKPGPKPAPVAKRYARQAEPIGAPVTEIPVVIRTKAGDRLIEEAQRTTEIDQEGVDLLLAKFISAYEAGDADGFAGLFDERAVTDDGVGQGMVRKQYGELFRSSSGRAISIDRVAWRGDGRHKAIVFGLARVELQNRGASAKARYLGGMMMRVYKDEQALKIFELHHRLERQ